RSAPGGLPGLLPAAARRTRGEHAMTGGTRIARLALSALVAVVLFFGGAVYWLVSANGFSARTIPTPVERLVMRALHRWSVPSRARNAVNTVAFSPAVWAESRAHFVDHCASCHVNDGRGKPEMGYNLFIKALEKIL